MRACAVSRGGRADWPCGQQGTVRQGSRQSSCAFCEDRDGVEVWSVGIVYFDTEPAEDNMGYCVQF